MNKNSIVVPGLEDLPELAEHERQEKQIPPMGPIRSKEKSMFRCAFTNKLFLHLPAIKKKFLRTPKHNTLDK